MDKKGDIAIINGPNLNRLGIREPELYGAATLGDIEALCRSECKNHGFGCRFMQSNAEAALIEAVHSAIDDACIGIVINAAGYTHTSIALRDALSMADMPIIETHISNIYARESFRHHSYISGVSTGVIAGFGADSYRLAISAVANRL